MKLDEFFAEHPKAALAFSGGTDSAFLLYAARSAGADVRPYMIKYGETEIAQTPDVVFWASVYKAICGVKDTPEAIVSKAKAWLHEHGMSPNLAG